MFHRRSQKPVLFFSHEEKRSIQEAIKTAEQNTSGEIRVHLEKKIQKSVLSDSVEIFNKIGMHKTKDRNGVLILMCISSKQFAVIGDLGINEKVPENFWEDIIALMKTYFVKDQFAQGLSKGILKIGEKLKIYFPYEKDDINELPDKISFSE